MGYLKKAWQMVRRFLLKIGHILGLINTTLLLTFSFYVILLPTALYWRLKAKQRQPEGWRRRAPLPNDHFSKQY